MSGDCPNVGKSVWPELLGVPGGTAVTIIERENPSVNAVIVRPDDIITPVIQCDRVRVFVNAAGNVQSVPTVG